MCNDMIKTADVSDKAAEEYEKRLNAFTAEHFSDMEDIRVPGADTVDDMLRWACWSTTPVFSKKVVQVSASVAFLLREGKSIQATCANDDLELSGSLAHAHHAAKEIRNAVDGKSEDIVQIVQALTKVSGDLGLIALTEAIGGKVGKVAARRRQDLISTMDSLGEDLGRRSIALAFLFYQRICNWFSCSGA